MTCRPRAQVIVGHGVIADGGEAFRWTRPNGMAGLGICLAEIVGDGDMAVSSDGNVIVGYGDSNNGIEAFRWTPNGGMVGLGDLPDGGFFSEAYGVSADGSVVVGRSSAVDGRILTVHFAGRPILA